MNKSRYVFFILACLFGLYVQAQNRTVKGRVLSAEDKEPLIGATVKIPGTSIGVVTDIDGNFSLEVPDKDKTLVIEFLGMSTLTAKIPANGVLNVSLHPNTQRLDEVVVTGYGNFSKSSFIIYRFGKYITGGLVEERSGCIGRTEVAGYDSGRIHFGKFRSAGC